MDGAASWSGRHALHAWRVRFTHPSHGRVVEVVSGQTLGAFLKDRVLGPLGMEDAAFTVPERDHGRIAEAFARDPENGTDVALLDVKRTALFESGGGGLAATTMDYARFLAMLLGSGKLGETRILGRKTVELMTSDHQIGRAHV